MRDDEPAIPDPKWMSLLRALEIMTERLPHLARSNIETGIIAALRGGDITARLIVPPNDEVRMELEIDRLDWEPVESLLPSIEDVHASAGRAMIHAFKKMAGWKPGMPRRWHYSSAITDNHVVYALHQGRISICRDDFLAWLGTFIAAQSGARTAAISHDVPVERSVVARPASAKLAAWFQGYLQHHPDPSEAMVLDAATAWCREQGHSDPTRQQIRKLLSSTTAGPRKRGRKPKRGQ